MAKMSCFPALLLSAGRRKKHRKVADAGKVGYNTDCPKVKPVEFTHASIVAEPRDGKDATAAAAADDGAVLKGGEQIDEKAPVKKGDDDVSSDFEFECHAAKTSVGSDNGGAEKGDAGTAPEQEDTTLEASPRLKRSCSNIETKSPGPRVDDDDATPVLLPARSFSYSDLTDLPVATAGEERAIAPEPAAAASPAASAKTSRSADRVMLKKRSSSQVLPSRSRKLWWRLFLWSHRNLHRARSASARPSAAAASCPPGRHGGYTSDTHEEDRKNKKVMVDGSPPPPPHPPVPNQWVAFCADNSLRDRVSAWVSSIENEPLPFRRIAEEEDDERYDADADDVEGHGERPRALLELGESSAVKGQNGKSKRSAAADEVNQANSVVQSLNAFSTVAHICGVGLKVVPMVAPFSSLRAVNLSSNFIVHISPGSLPKGLHSLDLSRNKITAIEGLRELTKLRVLNLSYNRISRIGHGLSNCTAIKELYLAGNKISDVEGLHRLLKLAVLDLSFNKITTAKALGQLVANYHSLLALNLVGNPVQANFGDDALRRAVTGLLPHLTYLNKQPVKPQRSAREAATDSVARAALGGGGGGRSQRRRAARRLGTGSGEGSVRSRSKGRHHGSGSTKK